MKPTLQRPYQKWWLLTCRVCGCKFKACRTHAKFHSVRCRVRYHRGAPLRFNEPPVYLGWSYGPPSVPDLSHRLAELIESDYCQEAPTPPAALLVEEADPPFIVPRETDQELAEEPAIVAELAQFDVGPLVEQYLAGEAVAQLGLDSLPTNRAEYERARKRVVNLLAASGRSREAKDLIRVLWKQVQEQSPYRPRVRSVVS